MGNKSIWDNEVIPASSKKFPYNFKTNILIIGGGITGLTAAYFLCHNENDITVIDRDIIGHGVTSKTTAKITYLQGLIYTQLEKSFGKDVAKKYLDSQREAISIINKIVSENKISCDLTKTDSIVFTTEDNGVSKINDLNHLLKKWNIDVEFINHSKIKSGIKVTDTYCFNPLKYLNGLKKVIESKVNIYEDVLATNIQLVNGQYQVNTSQGIISCNKVVIACYYPFFLIPSFIPLKTYIKREYVNAAKVSKVGNFSAINIDDNLHSIRFYKNYLIYGSNQQRLTSKTNYQIMYDKSREDFKDYFGITPEYTWMNQDIISNDHLPFIGNINHNLYLATAYHAWGMTNGTIAGKIISDLILDKYNPYQKIFDPKRNNLTLFFDSLFGSFHYVKVYAQSLWKKNNPSYVKIKNIIYGIYIDDDNKKHVVKLICPHMKCNLVFNQEEKTWDCPCHGSRFDLDGNIILGPAVKNISKE